jgi:hypothetical protein
MIVKSTPLFCIEDQNLNAILFDLIGVLYCLIREGASDGKAQHSLHLLT